ncbi:MAG: hypothetical protein ACE5RN_06980 [Nitrosopumilaceae archaeon]
MKKGRGIGITVAVFAAAIVIGIASLPDEVLLESPELDTSKNTQNEMIPLDINPIEEAVKEPIEEAVEEPIEEAVEEPIEEAVEEPIEEAVEESDESEEGNLIEIKIKDGVGGGER